MQTERIKELIAARIEARKHTASAETFYGDATEANVKVVDEIVAALPDALAERWGKVQADYTIAVENLAAFKKAEKEAEETLRAEVEREAVFLQVQGKDVYGRGFHPNINITKEFSIELPQNPYELGAVVTELAKKGLRESITITVRGFTDKYRETIFESPLLKRETPSVKLDAASKWLSE